MSDNITLCKWIELFNAGSFTEPDFDTQVRAGWYDWFCEDNELRDKTYKLAPKVIEVAMSPLVDTSTTYVFFKNNCPMHGELYDDFRLCDLESGDVLYTITPERDVGGDSELWSRENGFDGSLVEGTWADVCKYLQIERKVSDVG